MDDGSLTRLEQLFPRLDVLSSAARLQLSELLATPFAPPALLGEEIAQLALPRPMADSLRQSIRALIEKGVDPDGLTSIRALRLSDVVPSVGICAGGPADAGCPARLREVLRRNDATTWATLAPLTLEEMARWTNVGPQALASLIGLALAAVLDHGPAPVDDSIEPSVIETAPALVALLLGHERSIGCHGLRVALEGHADGDGPADIRAAAARLLAATDRAGHPRLALLGKAWEAAGDHRDQGLLFHRALRLDQRPAAKELAGALGVSVNRVAQLQARAGQSARVAAGGAAAISTLVADLQTRLGSVCQLAAVDHALGDLALPRHDDPRSALLVWLAGPYQPVSGQAGWVATEPAAFFDDTRRILHEDGGVRRAEDVAADLGAAGLAADDVEEWLAGQPVLVLNDLVVALSGSGPDVAERMLSATGRAMTATELSATAMPTTTLDGRLRRDIRFVRIDRDHFELAEWGGEPFAEPSPAPAELFPGAAAGRRGRSRLRIEVDAAVLRGRIDPVPLAVVEALGVPCGGRRTFTTRFGPVALSHAATQPTRGSMRPVALAVGARAGDTLVLEFDAATGDASVELEPASSSVAG